MPTPVKVNHIIHLRGDDYQKIRIIKNDQVYYEGEVRYENGTIEELENAQVKHWSVDNGVGNQIGATARRTFSFWEGLK